MKFQVMCYVSNSLDPLHSTSSSAETVEVSEETFYTICAVFMSNQLKEYQQDLKHKK